MLTERRHSERSDVFLIVELRPLRNAHEFSMGIARNFSDEGLSIESQYYDLSPGNIYELRLSHPRVDYSVTVPGEIIWLKEVWFNRVSGIKLRSVDQELKAKLSELISLNKEIPVESYADQNSSGGITQIIPRPDYEWTAAPQEDQVSHTQKQDHNDTDTHGTMLHPEPFPASDVWQNSHSEDYAHDADAKYNFRAAAMNLLQRVHLNKIPCYTRLSLEHVYKSSLTQAVTSIRNLDNKSWLHIPLALALAGISTIAFSIEFDFARQNVKYPVSMQNDESGNFYAQTINRSGDPEIANAQSSSFPAQTAAAHVEKQPIKEVTKSVKHNPSLIAAGDTHDITPMLVAHLRKAHPEMLAIPDIVAKYDLDIEAATADISFAPDPAFHARRINKEMSAVHAFRINRSIPYMRRSDAHKPPLQSQVFPSDRVKRRVRPKSEYKTDVSQKAAATITAREASILQHIRESQKSDFHNTQSMLSSPLKTKLMRGTMHRVESVID